MNGILILALGHPYYGGMAFNLACSIRRVSEVPIHLVYHGNALDHLDGQKRSFFNSMVQCPEEYFLKNGKVTYIKAKTYLPELTPFDNTLFLDADMLWLKKPVEDIFNLDIYFTMENRQDEEINETTKYSWARAADLKERGLKRLPNLHSQFIYFKKTEQVLNYFNAAKKYFDDPGIKATEFNGDVADELAFLLAQMDTGIVPHQRPFQPCYWMYIDRHKTTNFTEIYEQYYCYSLGGKQMSTLMKEKYDRLVGANNAAMGIASSWKAINKSKFIKERQIF